MSQFNVRSLLNLQSIKDIEAVQELLQCLSRENCDETITSLKNSNLLKNRRITDFIVSIFLVVRGKTQIIDLYVRIIRELGLSEMISEYIKIGVHFGAIYLIMRLINENLISSDGFNEILKARKSAFPESFDLSKILYDGKTYYNKISRMIDEDNVNELTTFFNDPNKNINSEFKIISIARPFITKCVSLIEYSAMRGAIKCFKYLLINDAYIDENIMKYAIMGGNSDIIFLLEEKEIPLECEHIIYSIKYHQLCIYDWILERFSVETDELKMDCSCACIKYGFFHGLEKFHEIISGNCAFAFAKQLNSIDIMNAVYKSSFIERLPEEYSICFKSTNIVIETVDPQDEIEHGYKFEFFGYLSFITNDISIQINKYKSWFKWPDFTNYTREMIDKYIISNEISYNAIDRMGTSALMHAAEVGNVEVLKYLLEKPDININFTNHCLYEFDALGYAIDNIDLKCMELLLADQRLELHLKSWRNAQHSFIKNGLMRRVFLLNDRSVLDLVLKHKDLTLSQKEKDDIIKAFPEISRNLLDNVPLRTNDEYDEHGEYVDEDSI